MKKLGIVLCAMVLLHLGVSSSSAASFLYDWAFNVNGSTYEAGLSDPMPTTGSLDSAGLGTLTWSTNAVGNNSFIAFFDHEIDEATNTFYNEYGTAVNSPIATQSWEIDEPGYVFGDIYDNVLSGTLDNVNAVPEGSKDDVSWAMGWNFTLAENQLALISLDLSETAPGSGFYLAQTDPDSKSTIYFSSKLTVRDVGAPVPIPGTMLLMATGLLGFFGLGRRKFYVL